MLVHESQVLGPHRQPQFRQAPCQRGQCDLQFDAGEVLPDALMHPVAEGEVSAGVAVDIEGTGKGRLWGTAVPRYWLPLDMRRPAKQTLLCFDLGRRVKPCVSPDDPDRVIELLRGRVPVVEAPRRN